MNGLSMLGDIVAFLVGVQPGILNLLAAGLLVFAVIGRNPIRIRAQKQRREDWRN